MGLPIAKFTTSGGGTITLHKGDLTEESVDAIVNAANSQLSHGGGVAGAIIRRGGRVIQEESSEYVRRNGPVAVGYAVWTGKGGLPARLGIIHAVGPQWGEGNEPAKLALAARNAFAMAVQNHCVAIALPAISSGIFGFPKSDCARILLAAAIDFFESHPVETRQEIRFTIIDDETIGFFVEAFRTQLGPETIL